MGILVEKKELILLGGGHSHALVLRMLGMDPLDAARLTLVSNVSHTPYSGMLPGYVSGQYGYDETHIDLRRLAQFAGARFILGEPVGLDLGQKQIQFRSRPPLDFDLLSINIGSTPSTDSVPGSAEHAIPIKPVPAFLDVWHDIVADTSNRPRTLVIVGGGAGGVELALSMKKRLGPHDHVHLVNRDPQLLPSHAPRVRVLMTRLCRDQGIELHRGDAVSDVTPNVIRFASGKMLEFDHLFWVTNATPAPWLRSSGIAVDSAGFILTSNTLQSTSHDFVFAAGDVASMRDTPRPKSGVYAVRQAKPLLVNLRATCIGAPLRPYHPQKRALALIGTGAAEAVASHGRFAHLSPLMLKIKDRIDQRFMRKFAELP
jgi:selenide,water dikinase